MYKHNLKQLEFIEFSLPFQGHLSRKNKRVKLAVLIPWEQLEERYQKNFTELQVTALPKSVEFVHPFEQQFVIGWFGYQNKGHAGIF